MKRYYAVIDTNVIVSALLSRNQQSPTVAFPPVSKVVTPAEMLKIISA